jgi:hypothetical protein
MAVLLGYATQTARARRLIFLTGMPIHFSEILSAKNIRSSPKDESIRTADLTWQAHPD